MRFATHDDVTFIQSVLNAPENLSKLEGYPDERLHAAIDDVTMAVFVWEEDDQWQGFCWLRKTSEGTKIEEFGVSIPGAGIGSRFFEDVLVAVAQDNFPVPLWLAVAADNAAAIRFYDRFGFTKSKLKPSDWKRRKGLIADALIMTHAPERPRSNLSRNENMT